MNRNVFKWGKKETVSAYGMYSRVWASPGFKAVHFISKNEGPQSAISARQRISSKVHSGFHIQKKTRHWPEEANCSHLDGPEATHSQVPGRTRQMGGPHTVLRNTHFISLLLHIIRRRERIDGGVEEYSFIHFHFYPACPWLQQVTPKAANCLSQKDGKTNPSTLRQGASEAKRKAVLGFRQKPNDEERLNRTRAVLLGPSASNFHTLMLYPSPFFFFFPTEEL